LLGFLRSGKRGKQAYAFISSTARINIEEQKFLINMWSSMSRHSIEKWFIDDLRSLLEALKAKPLPVVTYDISLLDKDSRTFIRGLGIPIIAVKPKEGPPTVGC